MPAGLLLAAVLAAGCGTQSQRVIHMPDQSVVTIKRDGTVKTRRPDGTVVTTYAHGLVGSVTNYQDGAWLERDRYGSIIDEHPSRTGKYHFLKKDKYPEGWHARYTEREVIASLGLTPLPHAHSGGSGDSATWSSPEGCWIDEILNQSYDLQGLEDGAYDKRFVARTRKRDLALLISGQHNQVGAKLRTCRDALRARLRHLELR